MQALVDALDIAMYECPDRVWPGLAEAYRGRQILFVSVQDEAAYLWNDQSAPADQRPTTTVVPFAELPVSWHAFFNVDAYGGVRTVGISLDTTEGLGTDLDLALVLALHEAFHFIGTQPTWDATIENRSVPYPEPWEPRYLRAQQILGMLDVLREAEDASLSAVAYWRDRSLADHAEETESFRGFDAIEGSAEHAAFMSAALIEVGCDASEDELLAAATELLDSESFVDPESYSGGSESYVLGVVAGLQLRRQLTNGWHARVEDGTPPLDLALEGVSAEPEPDDDELSQAVQTVVEERNTSIGMEIEPMLERMSDPEFVRLPVPFDWVAGSFSLGGFYYLADDPNLSDVMIRFSATLDDGRGTILDVAGQTLLAGIPTPCAVPSPIVLTIPIAELEVDAEAGTASSDWDVVNFAGLPVESTEVEGLQWLCPTSAGGVGDQTPGPDRALAPRIHQIHLPSSAEATMAVPVSR